MCFSERVSWINLIFGWSFCTALYVTAYNNEERVIALFIAFALLMQLWEGLLWRTVNANCSNINTLYSVSAMITNHLLPVVFLLLCMAFLPRPPLHWQTVTYAVAVLYILAIVPFSIEYLKSKDKCTYKTSSGSLLWKWNNLVAFREIVGVHYALICMVLFLLLLTLISLTFFIEHRALLSLIIVGSFLTSAIIYRDRRIVGSLWCFFASSIPLIILLMRKS